MGRKSIAEERRGEILEAFKRCVVRYGLEGSSLERIAEEAGLKRSLIRHYMGNRDDLLNELVDHITQGHLEKTSADYANLTATTFIPFLLDDLFKTSFEYSSDDQVILAVLMSSRERFPYARQRLAETFTTLIGSLAAALNAVYPAASAVRCEQVAYALFNLSLNHETMLWVGVDSRFAEAARASALILLDSLGNPV